MKKLGLLLLVMSVLNANAYDLQKKWSFGLEYGLPMPTGTSVVKDVFEDDFAAGAKVRYHLSNRQALQLSYDHLAFDLDSGLDTDAAQGIITLNYLFSPFRNSGKWFNYISLGAGSAQVKDFTGTDDYWRTSFKAGLGVEYFVTRYFNLGLGVDYHMTQRKSSDQRQTEIHVIKPQVTAGFYFGGVGMNDADKDGVSDKYDQCANSAPGSYVDSKGCGDAQKDSDNDGVSDRDDKCGDTAQSEKVDTNGCSSSQLDSDNDGISNKLDQCPNTSAGEKVNSAGCTEKESVEISLNINFASNKAEVDAKYEEELSKVATFLKTYKDTVAEIEGHTDNSGSRAWNTKLSQMRADAVKAYLVKKHGVDTTRLSSKGYGPDKPIADNSTKAGRISNRRVVATFRSSK